MEDDDAMLEIKRRIYLTSEANLRSLISDLGIALDTTGLSKYKLVQGIINYLEEEKKGTDKGSVAKTAIKSFLEDLESAVDKKDKTLVEKISKPTVASDTKIRFHRDFKISGSIDLKSVISFNSVIRQVESGLSKGYSEADIVDGVIKAMPSSSGLRDYLEGKADLDLPCLRGLLRAHYNEKSATERYTELGAAKQLSTETPTEFLMRTLDLRNKILFASKEATSELKYDPDLVAGLFVRTVNTGLKDLSVRQEFRPFLEAEGAMDEELIYELNQIMSREEERKKKFGPRHQQDCKSVEAEIETTKQPKEGIVVTQMKELQGQMAELKTLVANMSAAHENKPTSGRGRRLGCGACAEQGIGNKCTHCFRCGASDHHIVGCRQRKSVSGNVTGLPRRGSEQP